MWKMSRCDLALLAGRFESALETVFVCVGTVQCEVRAVSGELQFVLPVYFNFHVCREPGHLCEKSALADGRR